MQYPNNFLHEVILEIQFPTILKLYTDKEDAAAEFQKVIKEEFPEVEFERKKKTIFIHENTGCSEEKTKDEYLTWIFSNGRKQIQLTAKNLFLIYKGKQYTKFEEFLKDVEVILKGLDVYGIKTASSLGLRFINQINIPDRTQVDEYINPNLHLDNEEFENERLIQSISKTELQINEEFNLIFSYGQFNPDYPSVLGEKNFIIDYDCLLVYDEEIENTSRKLKQMHQIISDRFEHDIKDKLREEMMA